MVSYYRKYIDRYSSLMAPIIKLLKSEGKLEWSEKCQEAFEKIKEILTSAPILTMPNS